MQNNQRDFILWNKNKQKLNSSKIIVIINGPSNSGKSMTVVEIFKHRKDFFLLKFDSLKRFFADFEPGTDTEKVIRLSGIIAKSIIDSGDNLLIESSYFDKSITDYAIIKNYKIFEFNLEVPYEVLVERFRDRILNQVSGIKINTSEEKLLRIYNKYILEKNNKIKTFDTSIKSTEEIVNEILKDIE